MKAVTSEILNHFSYNEIEIIIYTKNAYVEDRSLYFVNIGNVMLTSHPTITDINKRATIIPTELPQVGISKKARFHLLKNADLPLYSIIAQGSFSQAELAIVTNDTYNIVLRSGITINNLNIYREEVDYTKDITFILGIYLQNHTANFSKFVFIIQ